MFRAIIEKIRDVLKKNEASSEQVNFEYSPFVSEEGQARVVILEYYQTMRELYARYLGRNGFSYFITGNKQEFLSQVNNCKVIILDDRQPEIRGFQMASKLKTERPDIPVVICTADGLESYEEFKLSVPRADEFLMKPVSEGELIDCIKRVMVKVGSEPVEEKTKPAKRGRRPYTFLDIAEKHVREFNESGLSKAEFARKYKISLSLLKNEFKIASLSGSVKKTIRENIDAFKKSFFEYILKLKDEQSIIDICNEITERGKKGFYYDLGNLKVRLNEYITLKKNTEDKGLTKE